MVHQRRGNRRSHVCSYHGWSCHLVRLKDRSQHVFFGRYEHLLRQCEGQWRIAGKTVVLQNDLIPTMLDFYCI